MENGVVNLCESSSDETEQNICRLCSVKSELIDLFAPKNANLTMRILILLATGIEIKQNDTVSKMVCHRCCEIAVKLHKYRTNAVSNDKLLKEQIGLPYTPPITDQDELLRVASNIVNEQKDSSNGNLTNNSRLHCDPLELLQLSFQKKLVNNNKSRNLIQAVKKSDISLKSKIIPKVKYRHPSVRTLLNTYKNIVLPEEIITADISPVISLDGAEVDNWYAEQLRALKSKLKGITFKEVRRNLNHTPPTPTVVSKCTVTTSSTQDQVPPSTQYLVPSKDTEVTPPIEKTITVPKHSAIPPKHNVVGSSVPSEITAQTKKQNVKRSYSKVVDTSDNDSDDLDREEYQHFNPEYEQEDETTQTNLKTNVPLISHTSIEQKNNVSSQIPAEQQVATISNSRTPYRQSARKRTGRRSTTKRKRVSSKDSNTNAREKKTTKDDSREKPSHIRSGINLSQECHFEKAEKETVYTLPLDLTRTETLPELITGKALEIFMCPVCNKLYDTKKQLLDHKRTHLKCKFCKKKVRNLVLLEKHQNESCFINIVKNKPVIKLRKVDTIPSVLKEYAHAFEKPDDDRVTAFLAESNYCENIGYTNESRPGIEEVVLPMPSENSFLETEETVTNTNLITADYEQKSEVLCISISDDSDDELECKEVIRHKIVNNPFASATLESPSKDSQSVTVDLTLDNNIPAITDEVKPSPTIPPRNILSEKEMIRSLFKKHAYPLKKHENGSQTFSASHYNIKYTNTNLIILDSMFTELSAYKIRVHLEAQPKISARFKANVSVPAPSGGLEFWGFKQPIDIKRRVIACANRMLPNTLSNGALILNVVNTPGTTSRMLGTISNFSDSLLLKTPNLLDRLTPNVTMPVAKTTFTTANAVPFTLSSAATTNFYSGNSTSTILALDSTASFSNTNPSTNYIQYIEPSNTIQYQAPVVPQSSASVVLEMNQDRDKNSPPEKVVHVNNSVTNINKFFVLANNMQQIPTSLSNVNYGTSYLNNISTDLRLPHDRPPAIREIETVNQNSSVVPCNSNIEPAQAGSNRLRVKAISELN